MTCFPLKISLAVTEITVWLLTAVTYLIAQALQSLWKEQST